MHRLQPGEVVTNLTYIDALDCDRLADTRAAYQDAREAHEHVSRELAETTLPMRVYNLTAERKRLADIAWRLKRKIG